MDKNGDKHKDRNKEMGNKTGTRTATRMGTRIRIGTGKWVTRQEQGQGQERGQGQGRRKEKITETMTGQQLKFGQSQELRLHCRTGIRTGNRAETGIWTCAGTKAGSQPRT
jgi:hypothetical protein